ncbi:hypothetical protein [Thalassolituus maritimus]|uniref:ABC transporter substrate-binding protein n=1 Tax=Thalassolituus maritimus TaxID=484498 RepID=A0ABQ0A133_9GAMM
MDALIKGILTLMLFLSVYRVHADVALLVPVPNAQTQSLATELEAALQLRHQDEEVDVISPPANPDVLQRYSLIVTVGASVLTEIQKHKALLQRTPVVATYISEQDYHNHRELLSTGVYVEPPLHRQIALAQLLFGDDAPLGILVPESDAHVVDDTDVSVYPVKSNDNLNQTLVRLLTENRALIGVYDTELYSSENIKSILITSYRHNRPMIGPSLAYLRAGALATTYSNTDDVIRRLIEVIEQGLYTSQSYPPPSFNPYFRVGLNEQVGRSLNMLMPDADELGRELLLRETQQ